MAVEKEIVVAIEFGSSKIRGVAGCKNIDGSVQVLDIEQIDARNCIRKGVVYNIDKTVMCIKHITEKIEGALGMRVCRAFIGIGGRSLRTKKNTVSRQFAAKTVVSQELVDSLLKSNRSTSYAGYEILEVVPQEYHVGLDTTVDPVGVLSSQIDAVYLNVIAKTEVKEYILKCVDAAGLEVAGLFVSPMVLAECVLTDTEKRSGCALVDLGYGTTTVAVYKNNLLRHLAVIPLGSNNITQDLCSLQIDEEEAEGLKLKYGSAYSELNGEELAKNLLVNNGRTIEERLLVDIMEAREEEILGNVAAQIRYSGYQDKLLAGIVFSGAASNVKNLDKAASVRLRPDKTRFARTVPFALQANQMEQVVKDGSLNTLLALMNEGNLNCVEPKEPENAGVQEPPTKEAGTMPVNSPITVEGGTDTPGRQGTDGAKAESAAEKKPRFGLGSKIRDWFRKATDIVTEDE